MLQEEIIELLEKGEAEALRSKALAFLALAARDEKDQLRLVRNAVEILGKQIAYPGFSRADLKQKAPLGLLLHSFVHQIRFGKDLPFVFSGKGVVRFRNGVLTISPSEAAGGSGFTLAGGSIEVTGWNEDRLKPAEREEADLLDEFAQRFVLQQKKAIPRVPREDFQPGDRVTITGIKEEDGHIACTTAGRLKRKGRVQDEELVRGTSFRDLLPYLYENDFIVNAVTESCDEEYVFSIRDAYLDYALRQAEMLQREGCQVRGKLLRIDEVLQRMVWLTADGILALSRIKPDLKAGCEETLYVVNTQTRQQDHYINVDLPDTSCGDPPIQPFEDLYVLSGFILEDPPEEKSSDVTGGKEAVRQLARVLAAAHPTGSLEKYRTLLAAQFLATAAEIPDLAAECKRRSDMLERKLLFAQRKTVHPLEHAPAEIECLVHEREPESYLGTEGTGGMVARLLTAGKAAREFPDIFPTEEDTIRRKVCALLGVEDAFRASGAHVTGKYGLGEGNEVEFKSSYVMRNDGRGPDLEYQGRGQVFEAVCGFLNAAGGVLFLGVNDSGDPITTPGRGLDGDMAWFIANYSRVNARGQRLLGHPVPKADTIDHFVLFLQQEKKIYFKDTLQDNITIEPTEDADAIRITVKPAEYEIAYLYKDRSWAEGTAYVRDGNQTLPMTEEGKRRRLMSLKRVDRNISHLVRLQEAIDKKHKVYLRGYASGNSGEVRDRLVVPINLFYDDEKVWCFDLEDRNFKQFNLSRITEVDSDVPEPEYNHDFKPCEADVFSWVDKDHDYPVRLRLDVMAYNYLVEHFAGARHLPENELYQEDGTHWILETTVHGLGPLRWYYIMLADKIQILDSPAADALKEEVRKFVEKWLA